MIGGVMSLEGLRRSWIGGTSLGIFVALESDRPITVGPSLDQLENLNDIALSIIEDLPPFLNFAAAPFRDYHTATKAFIECIRSKTEGEIPGTGEPPGEMSTECAIYW